MKYDESSFEQRFFEFLSGAQDQAFRKVSNSQKYIDLGDEMKELCDKLESILGVENQELLRKLCDVLSSRSVLELDAAYMAGMRDHMKLVNFVHSN